MSDETQCVVMDKNQMPWGPFATTKVAADWARKKWPEIPEYNEDSHGDGTGGAYWEVIALHTPD